VVSDNGAAAISRLKCRHLAFQHFFFLFVFSSSSGFLSTCIVVAVVVVVVAAGEQFRQLATLPLQQHTKNFLSFSSYIFFSLSIVVVIVVVNLIHLSALHFP